MKFILDAQLSPRLAKAITRAGHDAQHVLQCGLMHAKDRAIWQFATRSGAILVTKDEDFAVLRQASRSGPAVVWLRLGNIKDAMLQKIVLAALDEIAAALEAGETLIEIR